jgi:hypothetical protein
MRFEAYGLVLDMIRSVRSPEVRAALDVGRALGYLDGVDLSAAKALLDRCAAILWRLTH